VWLAAGPATLFGSLVACQMLDYFYFSYIVFVSFWQIKFVVVSPPFLSLSLLTLLYPLPCREVSPLK